MTLANKITIIRILFIPIFIILLLQGYPDLAAAIFTLTILTDALDGFVARKKKQKTALGAFLDPLADKLLMLSSFLVLTSMGVINLWIFIVVLSKDVLVVLGWTIVYFITHSIEIKPRLFGKLATIFQMMTIWLILLGIPYAIYNALLLVTAGLTITAAIDYVRTGSRKLKHHA